LTNEANFLILLVRQAGLEPATYGLEGRCSIRLGYWRIRREEVFILPCAVEKINSDYARACSVKHHKVV
jgi:hypothetical protein